VLSFYADSSGIGEYKTSHTTTYTQHAMEVAVANEMVRLGTHTWQNRSSQPPAPNSNLNTDAQGRQILGAALRAGKIKDLNGNYVTSLKSDYFYVSNSEWKFSKSTGVFDNCGYGVMLLESCYNWMNNTGYLVSITDYYAVFDAPNSVPCGNTYRGGSVYYLTLL
jgi:hypothetical protein